MLKPYLLFIILLSFYTYGQEDCNYIEYHQLSSDARTYARKGDYKKAVRTFKKAIKSVEDPKPLELYFLGKSYAELGKKKHMIKYLELAYTEGYWYSQESDSLSFKSY